MGLVIKTFDSGLGSISSDLYTEPGGCSSHVHFEVGEFCLVAHVVHGFPCLLLCPSGADAAHVVHAFPCPHAGAIAAHTFTCTPTHAPPVQADSAPLVLRVAALRTVVDGWVRTGELNIGGPINTKVRVWGGCGGGGILDPPVYFLLHPSALTPQVDG